ncbi:uncharacterized protein NECHADRAFT_51584 [Fusarium vanettenii 77-13-4]|uniref:TauD/TfdA-like domain-containing protein n=1 Tax=Fusarium vanettenii (strain ATCC MYA-4622 / CBS 123669 / FGSC 9596 / NRRL 45880 / 77-13-4) TaxID=660122 RepID=C7ZF04_FUSV7|nr:uncharacterized protein NECHADRAFT_51584 [Fusarium vanettenii 77-13-4]EEU37393.1 hypothetical protein NECHADRAFT_51584 [Fusarium vanettenii 77-13-4]
MAVADVTSYPPVQPSFLHDVAVDSMKPLASAVDTSALETSSKILDIIGRYRLNRGENIYASADQSVLKFIALIYTHVKAQQAVPLCLPAFPFKSPNSTSKVLGKLPDKAEEFALSHLNGMCQAIADIYPPGAKLTIISDGLVYNDLLGVPDKDVWNYGETLRALAASKGFAHISFARLRDLVDIDLPKELDEMTYVANASNFRRALLNTFSKPGWTWDEVRQAEDACMTYRGYIKFLQTDLETVYPIGEDRTKSRYKRGTEYIAKQMMARGDAFANAVRQKYPDHVRLSIHPSTGAVKLSISLLPTDSIYTTPWHSTLINSPVVLRGFVKKPDRERFINLSHQFGTPLPWKFGLLLEVKDRGLETRGLNNVLSAEPMPMHYDGLFKTVKQVDESGKEALVSTPPQFQLFEGATASPRDTGFTIFASSTLFFKFLPKWLKVDELSKLTWSVSTSSFDQTVLKGLPLVVSHPTTEKPCLRYHEPWPQSKTQFDATDVIIEGQEPVESASICAAIDATLYDRRVAYYHAWDKGDIVVSDNVLMMHTRSDFTAGIDRELWRIHFD